MSRKKTEMQEQIGWDVRKIIVEMGYDRMCVADIVHELRKDKSGYKYMTSHRIGHWMANWNRKHPDFALFKEETRKGSDGWKTYYCIPQETMETLQIDGDTIQETGEQHGLPLGQETDGNDRPTDDRHRTDNLLDSGTPLQSALEQQC
jgi:hypothetical protein